MSGEGSPPPTPTAPSNSRTSFSRQTLADLFGRSPPASGGTPAYPTPGPIVTAAANAQAQQRRRNSVTQALAGSPTGSTSPFTNRTKTRQSSFGSSTSPSTSIEENAVEDGDAPPSAGMSGSPTNSFARRVSFGARTAARGGGGTNNGEGFDWSEQIKNRAQRSTSMTQRPGSFALSSMSMSGPSASSADAQPRSLSTAIPEQPIKEMPKEPRKPDHFQERILKGDFYMD